MIGLTIVVNHVRKDINMDDRACNRCMYWNRISSRSGQCRIYPPTVLISHDSDDPVTMWPITRPDSWCGEGCELEPVEASRVIRFVPKEVITKLKNKFHPHRRR